MGSAERRYHHGNLPAALITAGLDLVRAGGPSALGLREVTRAVGVTPNAAYRHFTDRRALVMAVAAEAQQQLATAMASRMSETDTERDPAKRATLRLRALGCAYIDFAVREPGLFELAFATLDAPGPFGAPPYQLLLATLDDLVKTGVLLPERRPNAEWACWAAVHGLSDLLTRGPLRGLDPATTEQLADYVIDRTITGITSPDAADATAKPAH